MFGTGRRAVQLQFVKPQEAKHQVETKEDPYEAVNVAAAYSEVAKDFITHTTRTVLGAFVVYKIVERICR